MYIRPSCDCGVRDVCSGGRPLQHPLCRRRPGWPGVRNAMPSYAAHDVFRPSIIAIPRLEARDMQNVCVSLLQMPALYPAACRRRAFSSHQLKAGSSFWPFQAGLGLLACSVRSYLQRSRVYLPYTISHVCFRAAGQASAPDPAATTTTTPPAGGGLSSGGNRGQVRMLEGRAVLTLTLTVFQSFGAHQTC